MAVKGYTTKAKVEAYLGITISSPASIDDWIEGVEKIIDAMTGRNFKADSAASARLFDGPGGCELLIDDAVQVTLVEVGGDDYGGSFTEVASTGADRYFLDPPNYAVEGVPIRKVTLRTNEWIRGKQNHRITAKWGYSAAVPKDVEFAATVFVAGIYNQNRAGGDQIKSEHIGNYTVTYNSDQGENSFGDFNRAKATLEAYRKLRI